MRAAGTSNSKQVQLLKVCKVNIHRRWLGPIFDNSTSSIQSFLLLRNLSNALPDRNCRGSFSNVGNDVFPPRGLSPISTLTSPPRYCKRQKIGYSLLTSNLNIWKIYLNSAQGPSIHQFDHKGSLRRILVVSDADLAAKYATHGIAIQRARTVSQSLRLLHLQSRIDVDRAADNC